MERLQRKGIRVEEVFSEIEKKLRKRYYGWEGSKQFEGTGDRLARTYEELCWTNERVQKELKACFDAAYVDSYNELLTEGPIEVWTLCPHHLLPCSFTVHVGYVPDEMVLGLSKLARIAIILGKRPVIQEMFSRELVEVIETNLKPRGTGTFIVGEHGCMRCRGVRQNARVTTTVLRGVIENRPESRAEFLSIVKGGNLR